MNLPLRSASQRDDRLVALLVSEERPPRVTTADFMDIGEGI